jgi:hypothetical protein
MYMDWYYWTRNQYAHFIVFRDPDARVATGTVKPSTDGTLQWQVKGPCWSSFEEEGAAATLDAAKSAVDQRVLAIIKQEFKPEYIPPLG